MFKQNFNRGIIVIGAVVGIGSSDGFCGMSAGLKMGGALEQQASASALEPVSKWNDTLLAKEEAKKVDLSKMSLALSSDKGWREAFKSCIDSFNVPSSLHGTGASYSAFPRFLAERMIDTEFFHKENMALMDAVAGKELLWKAVVICFKAGLVFDNSKSLFYKRFLGIVPLFYKGSRIINGLDKRFIDCFSDTYKFLDKNRLYSDFNKRDLNNSISIQIWEHLYYRGYISEKRLAVGSEG